jgi:NAD(P)-dependent dehydrogenase (short-subunit alcohol dehydrogenase family)
LVKTSDWSEIIESFMCLLVSIRQEATNMAHENKVALVTGSNRGIGFEAARQLGKQGATVVVSARTEHEAAQAARKLREEGIEADSIALDVTKATDRSAAAKYIESHYGRLDILVNNAGVGPTDGLIGLRASASTESELQSIFNINLFSLVALTHELLPFVEEERSGQDCQPRQHPRLPDASINGAEPDRADAEIRLQRIESCSQCVHDSSGSGTQGHQYQGEFRTSGLGQDRSRLGRGADVCA